MIQPLILSLHVATRSRFLIMFVYQSNISEHTDA